VARTAVWGTIQPRSIWPTWVVLLLGMYQTGVWHYYAKYEQFDQIQIVPQITVNKKTCILSSSAGSILWAV